MKSTKFKYSQEQEKTVDLLQSDRASSWQNKNSSVLWLYTDSFTGHFLLNEDKLPQKSIPLFRSVRSHLSWRDIFVSKFVCLPAGSEPLLEVLVLGFSDNNVRYHWVTHLNAHTEAVHPVTNERNQGSYRSGCKMWFR